MAQSRRKPIGLPDPDDELQLCQPDIDDPNKETASILQHVVAEHNGNTNRTHHTVLFLMELRVDLENRYFFVDIRHEAMATTGEIEDAMFLSEDFLQNITDINGAFQKAIQPCLESAERMRNLAKTSASGDPNSIAKLRKLRVSQHKRQTAWDFDESVTFRRLSEIK